MKEDELSRRQLMQLRPGAGATARWVSTSVVPLAHASDAVRSSVGPAVAGEADSNGVYVTGLSFFQGSAVGDVAWTAIALAQLYNVTGQSKYLNGALWAANFVETTTRDNVNVPPGGYYFGNG